MKSPKLLSILTLHGIPPILQFIWIAILVAIDFCMYDFGWAMEPLHNTWDGIDLSMHSFFLIVLYPETLLLDDKQTAINCGLTWSVISDKISLYARSRSLEISTNSGWLILKPCCLAVWINKETKDWKKKNNKNWKIYFQRVTVIILFILIFILIP